MPDSLTHLFCLSLSCVAPFLDTGFGLGYWQGQAVRGARKNDPGGGRSTSYSLLIRQAKSTVSYQPLVESIVSDLIDSMQAPCLIYTTIYLPTAAINIFNEMISLIFSCDGTHYMRHNEFLAKGTTFWSGFAAGPTGFPYLIAHLDENHALVTRTHCCRRRMNQT